MLISAAAITTRANSISLDSSTYQVDENNQIIVTVTYDFTEFAMFGGNMNLLYDNESLELVSYTRANLVGTGAQPAASPIGNHFPSEGLYGEFGIGTFELFAGMSGEGDVGVFVFNFLSFGPGLDSCAQELICLTPSTNMPMFSHAGADVTADLFAAGITSVNVAPVPIPGAIWFLFSGVGLLAGLRRSNI